MGMGSLGRYCKQPSWKDARHQEQRPLSSVSAEPNVQWFRFDLSDVLELRLENADLEEYSVKENDLIVCEGRAGSGGCMRAKCGWNGLSEGSASCPSLVRYQHLVSCISPSLRHVVTAHQHPLHRRIKHLTGKALATHMVPLPPLSEQYRIVAKVDELMGLIDRLVAAA